MWQNKARLLCQKRTWTIVLLGLFLPCMLVACNNPSTATPPQRGKVLYTLYRLWNKPVHSQKDLANNAVTLIAQAMRSDDGQKIWRTSLYTYALTSFQGPASITGNWRIISAGSTIFVAVSMPQKGQVFALDAQSGQVLWKTTLDGASIRQPVVAHGNLYLQVDDRVEALDGTSGNVLWSASPDAGYHTGELVVAGNAAYVEQEAYFLPAAQGSTYESAILRALRVDDGTEVWRREVANTITDQLASLVHVSIQADERTVYLLREGQVEESHGDVFGPYPRYTLFALNAQDGSPLWSDQTQRPEQGDSSFNLTFYNQVLYVVGANSLSAFQSQDGKQLWSWQTPLIINPFAPPNHIYGSSLSKGESFCALRERDGSKAWCADYNQAGPVLFAQVKIYLIAFGVTPQVSSSSEQPAQIYVLNESDGSLAAHYAPADVTRMSLQSIALS